MRYEDIFNDPIAAFSAAARFARLPDDPERLRRAVAFSSFEVLQGQERERGFRERMSESSLFFRSWSAGGWREALTPEQAARIARDHAAAMRRFGYLTEEEGIRS